MSPCAPFTNARNAYSLLCRSVGNRLSKQARQMSRVVSKRLISQSIRSFCGFGSGNVLALLPRRSDPNCNPSCRNPSEVEIWSFSFASRGASLVGNAMRLRARPGRDATCVRSLGASSAALTRFRNGLRHWHRRRCVGATRPCRTFRRGAVQARFSRRQFPVASPITRLHRCPTRRRATAPLAKPFDGPNQLLRQVALLANRSIADKMEERS